MDKRATIRSTGAVYTPRGVATAIVTFISGLIPARPLRILEPSVGDGAFLLELPAPAEGRNDYTLVDIDEELIRELQTGPIDREATFVPSDFTRFAIDHQKESRPPFDVIMGNPPFIRKHNFSSDFKDNLKEFSAVFDYPLADLKNSWAAFLVGAARLLSSDGLVVFVLPYELMTVDYGQKLLEHIRLEFQRIDIFVSDDKAFKDIEQDAVIFLGRKAAAKDDAGVFINRVPSFTRICATRPYKATLGEGANRGLELSGFLLPEGTLALLRNLRPTSASLSDYADSAPGVVSGANDFFILSDADAEKHDLSRHVLPILKKGSLAGSSPVFSREDFDQLAERDACRLLVIRGDKSELDDKVLAYLKAGEKSGVHLRYKCRHRRKWYEVPLVKVECGFFFKRSHIIPRLIVNEAQAYITDTAYGLRMKEGYTIRGLCFSFYTSLTVLFAEMDGRFYGGGVLELSPKEFRRLPIIYHEPSDEEWAAFLAIHVEAAGDGEAILEFGDHRLEENGLFSGNDLAVIREAWKIVRAHRMRHGGRCDAKSAMLPSSFPTLSQTRGGNFP